MRICLGDNCMKGGMSCERKCSFEMSPPECTEVSFHYYSFFLKRHVCVISSDPSFKDDNARLTTVTLKHVSNQ